MTPLNLKHKSIILLTNPWDFNDYPEVAFEERLLLELLHEIYSQGPVIWEPKWVRKWWWWLMEVSDILSSISIEGRLLPQRIFISSHWTVPKCGFSRDCFPSTNTPQPSGNLMQPQMYCLWPVSLLSQEWGLLQRTRFALFWVSRLFINPQKGTNTHSRHHKGDQIQKCRRIRAKLSAWHGAKSWTLRFRCCPATYKCVTWKQSPLLSLGDTSWGIYGKNLFRIDKNYFGLCI